MDLGKNTVKMSKETKEIHCQRKKCPRDGYHRTEENFDQTHIHKLLKIKESTVCIKTVKTEI